MRFAKDGGYPHERTCSQPYTLYSHLFAPARSSPKKRLTGVYNTLHAALQADKHIPIVTRNTHTHFM